MRVRKYLIVWASVVAGSVAAAVTVGVAQDALQSPVVQFRSETNFVEIDAVVTDENGNFVRDLTAADFEVEEDGTPQKVSVFTLVDLPIEPRQPPFAATLGPGPIEFDVRATSRNFDGRVFVLLLDDLQTTVTRTQFVRDAATQFVQRYLGPDDLAAIVYTSGRDEGTQELTSSRKLLLAAIAQFQGQKLPSAGAEKLALHVRDQSENQTVFGADDPTSRLNELDQLEPARQTADPESALRAGRARRALGSLEDVATYLTDIQGRRKALVLFSEGLDYDIYQPFDRGGASALVQDARDAVAAAQRANVSVYAVDPRGLNHLGGESINVASISSLPQIEFGTLRGFQNELLLAQESLVSLARETGGLAVINSNDMAEGLARIALDNSRYYLLGYLSDPARAPGRFRKIDVTVRRPGLRVRARHGFLPADPKAVARKREIDAKSGTPATLRAALSSSLPVGSLSLRVFAAPFKGTGKNASVLVGVEIDGTALQFTQDGGQYHEKLELSLAAVDQHGKVQGGGRQSFGLKLRPETYEHVRRTGIRFLSRLDLPPARYQIRVGALESVGNTTGTVPYDLVVPDYATAAFALSGVVLTSPRASGFVTTAPDPPLREILPAPPIVTRTFARQDVLTAFVELYVAPSPGPSTVHLTMTVFSADGRQRSVTRDTRPIEVSRRPITYQFPTEIPLRDLEPGVYVLRIDATSTASARSDRRDVPFEVSAADGR